MMFRIYPDGFSYYGREIIEALETAQALYSEFKERFSFNMSNNLQV